MTTHAKLGFVCAASLVTLVACEKGTPAAAGEGQVALDSNPSEAGGSSAKAESEPEPAVDEAASGGAGPEQEPAPSEPGLAPAPTTSEPGPVYFVINTKGIVRLDQAGAKLLLGKPERHVSDMFIGPDGVVYILDARSLRQIKGDAIVEVERFSFADVAPVDHLALAKDGSMWVIGSKGVGARVDGEWQTTPLEELRLDYNSAVEVAGDGTVWVIGSKAALYREGDQWLPIDVSRLGSVPLLLNPITSPLGPVHTTNGATLTRLGKTALDVVPLEAEGLVSYTAGLDIAADGHAGLMSGACDLVRVSPRPSTQPWRMAGSGYDCETAEAMALDAQHRFWVASREGLSVVAEDREAREYPAGSFPELAGRVSHMVVLGAGPELPKAAPVRTATLVGKILIEGAPAAEAPIELCPTVRLYAQGSPCSAAKVEFEGTTDAAGGFRFEGVPLGDYSVAVELDGKWRWSSPPSFAAKLREGEAYDMGALSLPKI